MYTFYHLTRFSRLMIILVISTFTFTGKGQTLVNPPSGLSTVQNSSEIPDILNKRKEVYFSFHLKSKSEINELTNLISIDRVDGNLVKAYANIPQYLKFMKLGYEITLLPPPGMAEGIAMAEHTILSPLTIWNFYPTYTNYESIMAQFQTLYPNICNLDTITTLASGRRLLVLKISDNVNTDEAEPEYLYTSSIHGDETTGYILMLHLADYLLTNYGTNPEATDLINNLEIYICPLANPDGTYYGGNSTVYGARRGNANNVDMNRNYPDPQNGPHPDGYAWQPETVAFMDFATQRHFTAAVNFHGGVEVVNYPWDTWATLHADDNWYQFTSRIYADTVHLHAIAGYMTYMNNGVTNGYAWYEVNGGRQDYMNYYHHCFESTIEISDVKLLPVSELLAHWDYNWRSLILMLKHTMYGIHGVVTSQATGLPVAAKIFISGHDNNGSEVYSTSTVGDYHRLLKAGTYTLEFSASCYVTQVIPNVVVTDYATVNLNVQLVPGPGVTTTTVSAITATTAQSGGNVTCEGTSPVTERGVCWGTSTNPVIAGPHTSDGPGTGLYSSAITGLSPATTYHVRAYATNASGTVYGNDLQFATSCGIISQFPWNEGFENSGLIPSCWTQQAVSGTTVNWSFIAGSGNGHPATAHTGSYNACLKDYSTAINKTRLILPSMNLSQVPLPQLRFWHTQADWGGDQDQLSVYYRTSPTSSWILLTTYISNLTSWTQETIPLPNASANYAICFEGNAKYGYGVCVDDVEVSTSCDSLPAVGITIIPDANPVLTGTPVTFTSLSAHGGTSPSWQWMVNGANIPGATNSTFSLVPVNNDQVTCTLTSNEICIAGNPAISNVITLIVENVAVNIVLQNDTVAEGQIICYDALQNITVAGSGTTFEIQQGGQVTMIAGQSILYLTGTTVSLGGYLNGYIAATGPFCLPTDDPALKSLWPDAKTGESEIWGAWHLYPNPSTGIVNLESTGNLSMAPTMVDLYNIRGVKILSERKAGNGTIRLDLGNVDNGIYMIRVYNEHQSAVFKATILK
jgi:hypothetical protein